ncbi:MAG: DNA methyltransferase [Elusimicrobiota bacterium]
MKNDNIILRVSKTFHDSLKIKCKRLGVKKSDFIRNAVEKFDLIKEFNFSEIVKDYKESKEEDKEEIVSLIFDYYRNNGFPYTEFSDEECYKKMKNIYKTRKYFSDKDVFKFNIVGLALANYFHPHMYEAKYENKMSPREAFDNDEKFKDCINRVFQMGNKPTPAKMRAILKTRNGVRCVGNFRPIIAKYIYETYCPQGGVAIDPCSGFSGRLLGCIAANKDILYDGIDVDPRTMLGNSRCASLFYDQYDFRFSFNLGRAENILRSKKDDYADLVFTSPPYFNLERYSEDGEQSSNKYNQYDIWREKFLKTVLLESYRTLKSGGYCIMNTKNINKYDIYDDMLVLAKDIGFVFEKEYKIQLINNEFLRSKNKSNNFHYEPIAVLKKRNSF